MSAGESEITVASLSTHRLIVAVANDGTTDVQSNLHPREAADVLRQLVDRYESAAGKDALRSESTRTADVPDEDNDEEFPSGGSLIRHPSHAPTRRYLAANPLPTQKGGADR